MTNITEYQEQVKKLKEVFEERDRVILGALIMIEDLEKKVVSIEEKVEKLLKVSEIKI